MRGNRPADRHRSDRRRRGIGVVDRRDLLPVCRAIAQAALVDVGRLDHQMGRHREIAEQRFADGDHRMFRDQHLAKAPHRDDAVALGRREQMPVFQLLADHGVGDVVGGEGEAGHLHQQRIGRQRRGIGQLRLDHLALLQVVADDDEVGRVHGDDPSFRCAGIVASIAGLLQQQLSFKRRSLRRHIVQRSCPSR
ncbi:hypothetical protein ACVI1L_001793 [Bradyrhizobium sp. USDA 4516]